MSIERRLSVELSHMRLMRLFFVERIKSRFKREIKESRVLVKMLKLSREYFYLFFTEFSILHALLKKSYKIIKKNKFKFTAILPLFLHKKLGLDDNTSTSIFHTFECMMLMFTIFGAIIADTWLGLYRSVISMSFIYIIGLGVISVAMIDLLHLPIE